MQNKASRPKADRGQNTTLLPQRGKFDRGQAIENALIVHGALPSIQIVELLLTEASADPEYLANLARKDLLSGLRSARLKQSRANQIQYALPGIGTFPAQIMARTGKKSLVSATCEDCARAMKRIGSGHDKSKREDPKYQQAKALYERMKAEAKKRRGITVGEVFGLVPIRK